VLLLLRLANKISPQVLSLPLCGICSLFVAGQAKQGQGNSLAGTGLVIFLSTAEVGRAVASVG